VGNRGSCGFEFGVLLVENVVFGKSWDMVFLSLAAVCLVGWKMVGDWNLGFMLSRTLDRSEGV
jgi:hypothetical protein